MQSAKPLLTVIIPTYKRANSLEGVVDSVIGQKFTDWRILISDDNSQDNTREIATKIINSHTNHPITYHCNSQNLREYQNVNQALSRCYGSKYVAVLQDDSRYIDMGYLAKAIGVMEREPTVVYVASHHARNNSIVKLWDKDIITDGKNLFRLWPQVWTFWGTCVFRYGTLMQLGGLDVGIISRSDSLMLLRLGLLGNVALYNEVALEEYSKVSGTYDEFYKDKVNVLINEEKYFRGAADFAAMNGISSQEANEWYIDRFANDVLAKLLNASDKERNDIIKLLKRYDVRIGDYVLKKILQVAVPTGGK